MENRIYVDSLDYYKFVDIQIRNTYSGQLISKSLFSQNAFKFRLKPFSDFKGFYFKYEIIANESYSILYPDFKIDIEGRLFGKIPNINDLKKSFFYKIKIIGEKDEISLGNGEILISITEISPKLDFNYNDNKNYLDFGSNTNYIIFPNNYEKKATCEILKNNFNYKGNIELDIETLPFIDQFDYIVNSDGWEIKPKSDVILEENNDKFQIKELKFYTEDQKDNFIILKLLFPPLIKKLEGKGVWNLVDIEKKEQPINGEFYSKTIKDLSLNSDPIRGGVPPFSIEFSSYLIKTDFNEEIRFKNYGQFFEIFYRDNLLPNGNFITNDDYLSEIILKGIYDGTKLKDKENNTIISEKLILSDKYNQTIEISINYSDNPITENLSFKFVNLKEKILIDNLSYNPNIDEESNPTVIIKGFPSGVDINYDTINEDKKISEKLFLDSNRIEWLWGEYITEKIYPKDCSKLFKLTANGYPTLYTRDYPEEIFYTPTIFPMPKNGAEGIIVKENCTFGDLIEINSLFSNLENNIIQYFDYLIPTKDYSLVDNKIFKNDVFTGLIIIKEKNQISTLEEGILIGDLRFQINLITKNGFMNDFPFIPSEVKIDGPEIVIKELRQEFGWYRNKNEIGEDFVKNLNYDLPVRAFGYTELIDYSQEITLISGDAYELKGGIKEYSCSNLPHGWSLNGTIISHFYQENEEKESFIINFKDGAEKGKEERCYLTINKPAPVEELLEFKSIDFFSYDIEDTEVNKKINIPNYAEAINREDKNLSWELIEIKGGKELETKVLPYNKLFTDNGFLKNYIQNFNTEDMPFSEREAKIRIFDKITKETADSPIFRIGAIEGDLTYPIDSYISIPRLSVDEEFSAEWEISEYSAGGSGIYSVEIMELKEFFKEYSINIENGKIIFSGIRKMNTSKDGGLINNAIKITDIVKEKEYEWAIDIGSAMLDTFYGIEPKNSEENESFWILDSEPSQEDYQAFGRIRLSGSIEMNNLKLDHEVKIDEEYSELSLFLEDLYLTRYFKIENKKMSFSKNKDIISGYIHFIDFNKIPVPITKENSVELAEGYKIKNKILILQKGG